MCWPRPAVGAAAHASCAAQAPGRPPQPWVPPPAARRLRASAGSKIAAHVMRIHYMQPPRARPVAGTASPASPASDGWLRPHRKPRRGLAPGNFPRPRRRQRASVMVVAAETSNPAAAMASPVQLVVGTWPQREHAERLRSPWRNAKPAEKKASAGWWQHALWQGQSYQNA